MAKYVVFKIVDGHDAAKKAIDKGLTVVHEEYFEGIIKAQLDAEKVAF